MSCSKAGVCMSVGDREFCACNVGYTGRMCSIESADCYATPCKHGHCENIHGRFTCICKKNYTGAFCEIDILNCEKSLCQNGATCIALERGYSCSCRAGFGGFHCEYSWNPCTCNPCANGGKCYTEGGLGYCKCPPDFWGKHCETERIRIHPEEKGLSKFGIVMIVISSVVLAYGFRVTMFRRRSFTKEVQVTDPYQMATAEERQRGKMLQTYGKSGSRDEDGYAADTGPADLELIAEEEELFQEEADIAGENPEDGMYRVTDPVKPEEKASYVQPTEREKTCLSSSSDPDFTGDTTSLLGKWHLSSSPSLGYKK